MTDRELADCPLLPCPWCGEVPMIAVIGCFVTATIEAWEENRAKQEVPDGGR